MPEEREELQAHSKVTRGQTEGGKKLAAKTEVVQKTTSSAAVLIYDIQFSTTKLPISAMAVAQERPHKKTPISALYCARGSRARLIW